MNLGQLDHLLALDGPDAANARAILKDGIIEFHDRIWQAGRVHVEHLEPHELQAQADRFYDAIERLPAGTGAQHVIQGQALQLGMAIGQTWGLMFQQAEGSSVPWPFLTILICWISVLLFGFGVLVRFQATVVAALLVGSLSVSAAIFLILELGDPYSGLIQLSDRPLRSILAHIGQ
jgi:hypothetical protein